MKTYTRRKPVEECKWHRAPSERAAEIARLRAAGLYDIEIAAKLSISRQRLSQLTNDAQRRARGAVQRAIVAGYLRKPGFMSGM